MGEHSTSFGNSTSPISDCFSVDLSGFLHTYGRIIDSAYTTVWTKRKHLFDVCSATASNIENIGMISDMDMTKPPLCHCTMTAVHHGNHNFTAKALGLSCVIKKRHTYLQKSVSNN